MEASLKTWVSAWDSKAYSPDQLDKGAEAVAALTTWQRVCLFLESHRPARLVQPV